MIRAAMPSPRAPASDVDLVRRLLREASAYRGALFLFILLQVVATPLALLVPIPLQVVVDQVLGGKPLTGFLADVVPAAWATSPTSLLLAAAVSLVVFALLLQVHVLTLW